MWPGIAALLTLKGPGIGTALRALHKNTDLTIATDSFLMNEVAVRWNP
jgi:hypothetical protein